MQSRTKFADQKRMHRRTIKIWILNVTCALSIVLAITHTIQLGGHCGREFRRGYFSEYPRFEALLMSTIQMVMPLVGIIGIRTKRGAVFFVGISFCICTVMITHIIDLLMGLIFSYLYGRTLPTIEAILEKSYMKLDNNILALYNINRIQRCKKCCGIHGPEDDYVKVGNISLIDSCCPPSTPLPCTKSEAYKSGCAKLLLIVEPTMVTYQILSAVHIVIQFYNYRSFLDIFV